jgi:ubiquitin carboxyl-terminal hydrolase 22/27/51
MWHASAELEGYGQQGKHYAVFDKDQADIADAHSFFLAALDQIHATAKGQMSSCNCIARMFALADPAHT